MVRRQGCSRRCPPSGASPARRRRGLRECNARNAPRVISHDLGMERQILACPGTGHCDLIRLAAPRIRIGESSIQFRPLQIASITLRIFCRTSLPRTPISELSVIWLIGPGSMNSTCLLCSSFPIAEIGGIVFWACRHVCHTAPSYPASGQGRNWRRLCQLRPDSSRFCASEKSEIRPNKKGRMQNDGSLYHFRHYRFRHSCRVHLG